MAGWKAIARPMIVEIRRDRPKLSQDAVAEEVRAGWKQENPAAPGHQSVKSLVSSMEKSGEVKPREV
jgi:hypothetical protein